MPRARLALIASAVALVAGCGDERASLDPLPPASEPAAAAPQPSEPAGPPQPAPPPEPVPQPQPAQPQPPAAELEAIVRAWSAALNAGDDDAAAALFAPGAIIAQGGVLLELATRDAARQWNSGLPCSGTIVELVVQAPVVGAVFELGDRPASRCDAPARTRAAALFAIEDGLITAWQQVDPKDVAELARRSGASPAAPGDAPQAPPAPVPAPDPPVGDPAAPSV